MRSVLTAAAILVIAHCRADAAPVDFVAEVRPILQTHCYACHGGKHQKSGLRLDIKSEAFKGGDGYGPSIVAGQPDDSPLVQFVRSDDADLPMPPEGERLSAAEIATLTRWVAEGAHWPAGADLARLQDKRDHWSFKPLTRPAVPDTPDSCWPHNAIDRFVLTRLQTAGLQPAPQADPLTWLRRVSLDLTGLPPTCEEAADFITQTYSPSGSESGYERVVDRLLASPRYGERWAQHWLDVVRYADTHGFEVNTERPHAWPYRDYVIESFNNDTPYDRFVREQIVGDSMDQDAATGFLVTASVLLPGQIGKDDASKRLARQDALDEIVVNVGQTFLALSVGCARCHDHKFDPIPQREYYAMQALVAGVEYADRETKAAKALLAEKRALESSLALASEGQQVFAGSFRTPDVIRLLARGDPEQPKDEVAPAVLSAIGEIGKTALGEDATEQQRRLMLADWIASPHNPLTPRVMANRLWLGHFGTALVETASDFGRSGSTPSHPELLDFLAQAFIQSGWSIKHMHRLIVLSATYRQSARQNDVAAARDGDVRLLWRFPSRRLEAEAIRDSILTVNGCLNLKMGGPGFDLFDKRGGLTGFTPVESFKRDGLRRMVYAHKVRRERDAVFGAFDCPDAGQSTASRRESTTPIQALNLFNSPFILEQSDALAARIKADTGDDVTHQIRRAYQLALGREADPEEISEAEPIVRQHGLATLGRVLFNSNEFLFLP